MKEEPGEATFFFLHPTLNYRESIFLEASPVKLFHFTPFNRKQPKQVEKPCQKGLNMS
jgi:hypothetical protein